MGVYIGIVHKDAGSAYGVTFPDAPGCFSASDHLDHLFAKAEEALSAWGRTGSDTRSLSALKADPEWAESFDTAVLVIGVKAP